MALHTKALLKLEGENASWVRVLCGLCGEEVPPVARSQLSLPRSSSHPPSWQGAREMDRHLKKMEDGAPNVLGAQPYPSHHFGRLGSGHVGRFLLYASFNNNKGEQLRSCRGLTDYLSYLSCQLDDATPALVCAELLERACCPMLQLLGTGMH